MANVASAGSGEVRRSELLYDAALIAAVHAAGCLLVLALGFDHVSDDDYARVTIAQTFAHSPRLDPSATSWLPFPFWMLGAVMAVFGRSLTVARTASIAFASLAAVLPWLALRMTGSTRRTATLAIAFALLSPWSLWLGAATVPESMTASFTAAAAIALGGATLAHPRARVGFALALFAACLSRYEAWPVAAVLAVVLAARGLRAANDERGARAGFVLAAIVAAGPLVWMAWNAWAHDDPLHFFRRVARFKRALGEGSNDTAAALLLYPRLFVAMRPDVLVALLSALAAARLFVTSRADMREKWLVPLVCSGAQIAFLAYGNVHDGAPAHHSERALLGVAFLTATVTAGMLAEAAPAALARSRHLALGMGAVLALSWVATGVLTRGNMPGMVAVDDRSAQIAAGNKLREEGAEHLEVTPCAYEHFALIAAYAAPERVETRPRSEGSAAPSCPTVERR